MIKFFRKIRYDLMERNKTGKYFKYAIGEIVLVVIGILIAVQINSWNTSQKLKADNIIFLKKMISELELNKERLNFLTDYDSKTHYLIEASQSADSLIKLSYTGLNKTHLDFIFKTRFTSAINNFNLHNGVYEELLNTGKLYTLGSDAVIFDIKNYYNRIQREVTYTEIRRSKYQEGLKLLQKGFFKLRIDNYYDAVNFNIKNYPWYFNPSSDQYQNMQIGLLTVKKQQERQFNQIKSVFTNTDSLIVVIKKELTNR